jgi:flagellar motor switch protein FliG
MAEQYPMNEQIKELNGKEKAAVLLITLGSEIASQVYRRLDDKLIEELTLQISNMGNIPPRTKHNVLQDFQKTVLDQGILGTGGIAYIREVLEKAVGAHRASAIISKIDIVREGLPFDFIRRSDPAQIRNFIQNEHPQTVALILAYLHPDQAAVILAALTPEKQLEVIKRLATMEQTAPEVIAEIEKVLERKLASVETEALKTAGGVKAVAEMLNRADRATEKGILESLEEENPEIAAEVKKLMFIFEDMILIDDRGIQQILREVDNKELALALKSASDELKQKIFKNMSKRAAEGIQEDMEYMGPVRLRNVEEAQQNIVAVVRRLEDAGEIVISGRGGGEDEIIV